MSRIRPVALALGLAVAVAACSDLPLPLLPTPTPEGQLPPISIMAPLDPGTDVGRAIAAWDASGIRDYTWVISYACECGAGANGPLEVTVIDGAITHIRTPTKELQEDDLSGFPLTVERVLSAASDATRGGGSARGTWGANGVPSALVIDYDPHTIDDELTLTVSRFDPAP
jgi:hypothetical protein